MIKLASLKKLSLLFLIFALIGLLVRMESLEFMMAANLLDSPSDLGLVDLVFNLFTLPLVSIYWFLPLSFSLYYLNSFSGIFEDELFDLLVLRFDSRQKFLYQQFKLLLEILVEYLGLLLASCLLLWFLLGHRLEDNHYHFIINQTPSPLLIDFTVIMVYIILGLFMVGLLTLFLFLLTQNGFVVSLVILAFCLSHAVIYLINLPDYISALLPFTQFSRASSQIFQPFGLAVDWFTPIFQLTYLVLLILVLIIANTRIFNHFER